MKIVLAEKVSPATLGCVCKAKAGWQIVTHDQIKKRLGRRTVRCRRAGGSFRRPGGRQHCWNQLPNCE